MGVNIHDVRVMPITASAVSRRDIDSWPIAGSALGVRVVHCLASAKVQTVGELREWTAKQLVALDHFGVTSRNEVRWFFNWTKKLETNTGTLPSFRAFLREFLNRQEVHVLEQRYGLTDPLFRPQMKRRTLKEIASIARPTLERVT